MARWTGEWLSGQPQTGAEAETRPRWPGERLGLPEHGQGAVAGGGRRLLAFVLDLLLAGLLTSLFVDPRFDDADTMREFNTFAVAVWALITVTPVAVVGFTPGMGACTTRVARLDYGQYVGAWRGLVRCALTFVILPTAIRDPDGRGWHDRITGTVVVRMR